MGDAEPGVWYALTLAIGDEGKRPRGDSWNPPIEMNRWLPPASPGTTPAGDRGQRVVTPPVDVRFGNEGLMLVAEMPGIPPDNIDIRVLPRYIEIIGAPAGESKPAAMVPSNEGRSAGGRFREWHPPKDIALGGARARLRDGVLELRLPRNILLSGSVGSRIPVR